MAAEFFDASANVNNILKFHEKACRKSNDGTARRHLFIKLKRIDVFGISIPPNKIKVSRERRHLLVRNKAEEMHVGARRKRQHSAIHGISILSPAHDNGTGRK